MISLMLKIFLMMQSLKKSGENGAEKNQMEFKSKLSSKTTRSKKSNEQLRTIDNITKFYKSQEVVIKRYNDYKSCK